MIMDSYLKTGFSYVSWKNHKKLNMICSSLEKTIRFLSLAVARAYLCMRKGMFDLNFSIFARKNMKIAVK